LQFADRPDGSSREYRYDEAGYVPTSTPYLDLLTGIIDEGGQRYGTYKYNSEGRVYQEYHGSGADLLSLTYSGTYVSAASSTIVATPAGQVERRRFIANNGILRDAGTDRCATANCSSITRSSNITYDANGNRDRVTDFNGVTTDYDYDTRGQETSRIEASNTSGASSPKRTIETQWHADFRVPVSRTIKNASGTLEAKTTWSYNTRGQATARCEIDPADAAAMSYTCSATSAPPAGAKVRRTVTTYCEPADVTAGTCPLVGLMTSVNGPRPAGDAGMAAGQDDRTSYTYYPSDDASCASNGACPHRKGDLWKVTNALGQVTTYVSYDKNGRVTRTQDANGTVTDFVYHVRGWLTDRIVRASPAGTPGAGDATTHIDYDAVGNVKKVTQPDGAFLAYTYDDAHRLIKIADNQNNTIDYCPGGVGSAQCLDAAGNRRVEQVKDPSGAIKRSLSRSYNQLSQLVRLNNAAGAAVEQSQGLSETGVADGYDGNGNRVLSQDGLGFTTRQRYDGLNRLIETIQNLNGVDTATANTATGYVYDTRDHLRQVTDPDGLNTVYDYDGLNNLTGLHSPDTGTSSYAYDLAGNRKSQTDARGVTSTYSYDALNRLTVIGYPTATLNVSYAYDQSNAVTGCATSYPLGRLTTMTDASGSTTYCYDRRGNVTRKKQVTGGSTLVTDYAYTVADRLASITYPSGAIVGYTRDALGRVKTVTWKANAAAAATTVVSNASYYPFGPLNVLTYGNTRTLSKGYDQDYAIDYVLSSAAGGLALNLDVDVMGNIVSAVKPGDLSRGPTPIPTLYAYDPLYRLKDVQQPLTTGTLESYTYNKTGDRLSAQLDAGPVTPYTYAAGSHRLASVGGVARTYDANGNTQTGTAPGRSLTYDDRNRLTGMSESGVSAQYKINGRGERVAKTVVLGGGPFSATSTTVYVYDEGGHLLGDYGATGSAQAEYVYLDDAPVAVIQGGALSYVETDHLGTPRVVADPATNAARWAWNFFGDTFGADAPDPSPSGAAAYTMNLRFPGQYYDAETNLNYNYFRNYDPTIGRYLESDPIGLAGGLNRYSYVDGSPLVYFDAYGRSKTTWGCAIGAVGGAIAGGAACAPSGPGAAVCAAIGGEIVGAALGCAAGAAASMAAPTTDNPPATCPAGGACPPCVTVTGKVVPVGTIAYRPLDTPRRPQHGITGPHYNIYKANQYPAPKCDCFWQPVGAVPPEGLPAGAMPIEPFAN
jgi:RHS repeat-associated protein